MIQTLSYFTIQSSLGADRRGHPRNRPRTRRTDWRILRLDALLGITITGLVFDLAPYSATSTPADGGSSSPPSASTTSPPATLLGWLIFGPALHRPQHHRLGVPLADALDRLHLHPGARRSRAWYPYPFLDVDEIGYGASIRNTAFVLVVAIVLVAIFKGLDRFRTCSVVPIPG